MNSVARLEVAGTRVAAVVLLLAMTATADDKPAAVPAAQQHALERSEAVVAAYPISGYWLFGRTDEAAWRSTLQRISRLGADTVIQFGSRPVLKTAEQIGEHPLIARCRFAVDSGSPPHRIYLLETQEDFGSALLARPGVDQRVELGEQLVWRLVLPGTATSAIGATSAARAHFDVVYITGRKRDSVRDLLTVAKACSCHVFVGMPCATPDPRYSWDPDVEALPMLEEVTRRILTDYAARYREQPAFVGLYQSLETPVSETCLTNVLSVYRLQHALVRTILPGKQILVSPYWDARKKNPNGTDISQIRAGIRLLAHQEVDILAPQDSRGTGKVGLFWPDQSSEAVDARLEPAVGKATYGDAYFANTTEFYRAARQELADLALHEGLRVALWANIEAFEPGQSGSASGIRRTEHERLEQAVMFAGVYPSRLISFMWDNYYTSKAGHSRSLGEELESVARRPLIVHVQLNEAGGAAKPIVWGYDLRGARAEIGFKDPAGRVHSEASELTEISNACAYVAHPLPARLQAAALPFDLSRVAPGAWISISATRGEVRSFHPYRFQAN